MNNFLNKYLTEKRISYILVALMLTSLIYIYVWLGYNNRIELIEDLSTDIISELSTIYETEQRDRLMTNVSRYRMLLSLITKDIEKNLLDTLGEEPKDLDGVDIQITSEVIKETIDQYNISGLNLNQYAIYNREKCLFFYGLINEKTEVDPYKEKILDKISSDIVNRVYKYPYIVSVTPDMDIKEYRLKDAISLSDNLNKDRTYVLLFSSIKENSDLYNISDFDSYGKPQKNEKLILIQLVPIEKVIPDCKPEANVINTIEERIDLIYNNESYRIYTTMIIIFISLLFILTLFNTKRE